MSASVAPLPFLPPPQSMSMFGCSLPPRQKLPALMATTFSAPITSIMPRALWTCDEVPISVLPASACSAGAGKISVLFPCFCAATRIHRTRFLELHLNIYKNRRTAICFPWSRRNYAFVNDDWQQPEVNEKCWDSISSISIFIFCVQVLSAIRIQADFFKLFGLNGFLRPTNGFARNLLPGSFLCHFRKLLGLHRK